MAAPSTPANLAIDYVGSNGVKLSWNNVANETGFRIYRSYDNVTFRAYSFIEADTLTYWDDSVEPETTYYYKISAYNADGESALSSAVNDTTLARSLKKVWFGHRGPEYYDANAKYPDEDKNVAGVRSQGGMLADGNITSPDRVLREDDLDDYAKSNAQFITLAVSSDLDNERVLTEGTGITLTDAGAGSTLTVATNDAEIDHDSLNNVHQDVTNGASPTLDGSNFTGIPDSAMDTDYVEVAGDTMTGKLIVDQDTDNIGIDIDSEATSVDKYGLQVVTGQGAGAALFSCGTPDNGSFYAGLPPNSGYYASFFLYRNLAAANTDCAVVVMKQENAGDDQLVLEVSQKGTGAAAKIGDETNYANFAADGELTLVANARVYKNIFIRPNALGVGGAAPASATVNGVGFGILEFANAADDYAQVNINVPSDMDVSADCQIKITWSVPNTAANMTWGYGYSICSENEDTEAAPTTGSVVVTSSSTADGKTSDILFTITGGTLAVGDLIQIYFYRDVSEDTYGNPVDVHGMVLKYVANKLGVAI